MKTASAGVMAALAILTISFQAPPIQAQGTPDGKALRVAGEKVRDAMLTGTHDEPFGLIATWLQGRGELNDESMDAMIRTHLDEVPEDERDAIIMAYERNLAGVVQELDPDGILGVKTIEDYLALEAPTLFAMEVQQLLIQADNAIAENRKAKWHEVNRLIYTAEVDIESREESVEQTFGEIRFMNRFDDVLSVTCVADGNAWQVVHFEGSIGEHEFSLSDSVVSYEPGESTIASNSSDARRAEGVQLMGSARNYSRVQFAKTGATPAKFTDFMTEAEFADWFTGTHFKLRNTIYEKPNTLRGAVVAVPVDEEDGWGAMYFNYDNGESEVVWYDTEEELEKALKAFETAR